MRAEMHAMDAHVGRVLDLLLAACGTIKVEINLPAYRPARDFVHAIENGLYAGCAARGRGCHCDACLLVQHANHAILDRAQRDEVCLIDEDALARETTRRLFYPRNEYSAGKP
jgi:hypothetical protein